MIMMIIIDATNLIVGRMATTAAKQALLGEEVKIINAEKAIISGSKDYVFAHYKQKFDRGVHTKGPFIPRMPDRFTRRIIRGMLPMAGARGRDAFKRILCYIGTPDEFKGKETFNVPGADAIKLPSTKKVSVGEICKLLGAKWNDI
jgi:large subunit ribosomal protein L13